MNGLRQAFVVETECDYHNYWFLWELTKNYNGLVETDGFALIAFLYGIRHNLSVWNRSEGPHLRYRKPKSSVCIILK